MDRQNQMIESVSSNLTEVIQKVRKVLDKLIFISGDTDARKKQLSHFGYSVNDASLLPLLYKFSLKRRSSVDYHQTSFQSPADAQSSQKKMSFESKCPPGTKLPPILKKSASYHSQVNLLEYKSEKQSKRTATLPEPLPLSSKSLHFATYKRNDSGGEGSGENQPDDDVLKFSATYGACEEVDVPAPNECGNEGGHVEGPNAGVWDDISQTGDDVMKAMCPIEEASEKDFSKYKLELEQEALRLKNQLIAKMGAEIKTLGQKQDKEIWKLKEGYDTAMRQIEDWSDLCDDLKSKIAGKEKELNLLRCEMDRKIDASHEIDGTQVIELHLWNVKIALKLCCKIVDSKGTQTNVMKNIMRLAKSAKVLEYVQQRPWSS